MAERNLDFDVIIDRKNTGCAKYDFAVENGMPKDVLPLWVADMDFQTSSYIQDAIKAQAEHGIYGYNGSKESYFKAISGWMEKYHNWKIEEEWLVKTPGVVFALATAVRAYTNEGDAVMIQQPVYHPFRRVIEDNDRKVVINELVQTSNGKYEMDYEDFEKKVVKENVKLFFLCNPQNPVGRVWSREELEKLGDICMKHGVIVVSDEIHSDFIFEGKHQVFADINEKFREMTITCTAPSKTFNIAGLQVSNIFIANKELREKFRKTIAKTGYGEVNAAGLVACETAYSMGEEWYEAMLAYIRQNMVFMKAFLKEHLPELKMELPEGTYLVWVDFRGLSLTEKELEELIVHKAGLWLEDGGVFGESGKGFQRINTACPRKTLETALQKLKTAIRE